MAAGDILLDSKGNIYLNTTVDAVLILDNGHGSVSGFVPCCCNCPTNCDECCTTYTIVVAWVDEHGTPGGATLVFGPTSGDQECNWVTPSIGSTFCAIFCVNNAELTPASFWQLGFSIPTVGGEAVGATFIGEFQPCPPSEVGQYTLGTLAPGTTSFTIFSIAVSGCPDDINPFP